MKLLTVKEAAAHARVSASLVYEWAGSGGLPCYRLGGEGKRGCVRIDERDLDEFLVPRPRSDFRAA